MHWFRHVHCLLLSVLLCGYQLAFVLFRSISLKHYCVLCLHITFMVNNFGATFWRFKINSWPLKFAEAQLVDLFLVLVEGQLVHLFHLQMLNVRSLLNISEGSVDRPLSYICGSSFGRYLTIVVAYAQISRMTPTQRLVPPSRASLCSHCRR